MTRALIVAHGQPSDPGPAAAELEALAARIAGHLPGWQVGCGHAGRRGAAGGRGVGRAGRDLSRCSWPGAGSRG